MAGKMTVDINVVVSGPLADGTAKDILHEWLDESKKKTADYAVRQLKAVGMDKTGRATGHYQAEIRTSLLSYNDVLISDPVVYGPWLEGSSERNRSTRFKGYRLWRKARDAARQAAPGIAESLLPPYLERIGGGSAGFR